MIRASRRQPRHHLPTIWLTIVASIVLLTACGGVAAPPVPPPGSETQPPTQPPLVRPTAVVATQPCQAGRLRVGDLRAIDESWEVGVLAASERARQWRDDARLVWLRVACQPLEPRFRWQGTFYAESAQSFFLSDTEQTQPAEVEPASVPALPLDRISFSEFQRSLARAGYADTAELSPTSGVMVRLNTPIDPFGPPGIPEDVVYHVAIEGQGEERDLFVSAADWTLYDYST